MKTRIGLLGLGGVGGFFGGLLVKTYAKSETVEIIFIARGETKKNIAESGFKILSDDGETVVFPDLVSDDPKLIGTLDYLICATKTYDIEVSFELYQKCIIPNTVILPLYNGVDATGRIQKLFPENLVLHGCVYIVSMIITPGVIKKMGSYEKLFFGPNSNTNSKIAALQTIFEKAKIESYLVENIEETVWEKFIFISALASATSYLNQNIGQVLSNSESKQVYISLLNEIALVASAKGLKMPKNIIEETIIKLEKSPQEATSSMHRDFLANHKTEVVSLTEFVVKEGQKYGVSTPVYQLILDKLQK